MPAIEHGHMHLSRNGATPLAPMRVDLGNPAPLDECAAMTIDGPG
jgi:hypothetical protein